VRACHSLHTITVFPHDLGTAVTVAGDGVRRCDVNVCLRLAFTRNPTPTYGPHGSVIVISDLVGAFRARIWLSVTHTPLDLADPKLSTGCLGAIEFAFDRRLIVS